MKRLLFAISLFTVLGTSAQNRFDKVEIKTHEVTDNVYMLEGAGGNILIQVLEKEVVMIDSQFAPLSDKLMTAIKKITEKPISFLINTHHHGDHTGGNENFNSDQVTVIAHENVLKRLEASDKNEGFLPEKTIEEEYELVLDDHNNMIIHVHNAHTDGDSFVYLLNNNVVHMGDVMFNGGYPFIDLKSGGSITGYIAAQKQVLTTINKDTKVVPGHGPLGDYQDVERSIAMLDDLRTQISEAIASGKSREEVEKDATITEKYEKAGYGNGFINSEKIRTTIYDSLLLEANKE
ncbi:MBL fold metallo-hydrolase [Nonlabens sp. Asnod2-A12]|uniref:MBL fold metallo-hydrolase n=1 Tax=Nonlabens sp. Asnod2-A12 TaxID=3160578 RepID=UPI003870AB78